MTLTDDGVSPPLDAGIVDVLLVDPESITDARFLDQLAGLLSPDEVARWQRIIDPGSRQDFLVSHAAVRIALSGYAPVSPAAWHFEANQFGRPQIAGPAAQCDLRFNLSHTAGQITIAIARGREVGVDVERVSPEPPLEIVETVFHETEIRALRRLPRDRQRERLFALWTLKEAYIKARGMGLSLPVREFWFDLDAPPPIQLRCDSEVDADPARWLFESFSIGPDHRLALAYETLLEDPARVRIVPYTSVISDWTTF